MRASSDFNVLQDIIVVDIQASYNSGSKHFFERNVKKRTTSTMPMASSQYVINFSKCGLLYMS